MTATPGVAAASNQSPLLHPITLTRSQRIIAAAVFTLYSILWQIPPDNGWFLALALLIGFASLFVALRAPEHPHQSGSRRRPWIAALLFLAIALNVGYESCPHARYVSFAPTVAAVSGKPCHNQRRPHTLVTWLLGVRSAWWD